jgi:amino acid transporter
MQVVLAIALIWLAGGMNLLGIRPVGFASIVLTAILLAPFAALVIVGLPKLIHFVPPTQPLYGPGFVGALGAGLTVVIWNFGGWENLSVVSAELDDPKRNYIRAIAIALPMVVAGYVLPLLVSVSGVKSTADWQVGSFATEGLRIGGPLLKDALALGGTVMSFAVFEAGMLWVSRMPFILAREAYLPRALGDLLESTATPSKAIVLCCVVFTILVPLGFLALVVLDVFFYMAALALEMLALLKLRRLRPHRDGLFVIGGGNPGLYLVTALPLLTWAATFGLAISQGGAHIDFLIAIALGATVLPAYAFARRRWGGPKDAAIEA